MLALIFIHEKRIAKIDSFAVQNMQFSYLFQQNPGKTIQSIREK